MTSHFCFILNQIVKALYVTKRSPFGVVPCHLGQNWSRAADLKFQNFFIVRWVNPLSLYCPRYVNFTTYSHDNLMVDGSNTQTLDGECTETIK